MIGVKNILLGLIRPSFALALTFGFLFSSLGVCNTPYAAETCHMSSAMNSDHTTVNSQVVDSESVLTHSINNNPSHMQHEGTLFASPDIPVSVAVVVMLPLRRTVFASTIDSNQSRQGEAQALFARRQC